MTARLAGPQDRTPIFPYFQLLERSFQTPGLELYPLAIGKVVTFSKKSGGVNRVGVIDISNGEWVWKDTSNPYDLTETYINISNGYIFANYKNKYYKYSSTGTLLQTYGTLPLELGFWKFTCKAGFKTLQKCNLLHFDIEYPDAVYIFEISKVDYKSSLEKQIKIGNNLIIDNQNSTVYAYGVTSTVPAIEGRKERRYLGWSAAWQKQIDHIGACPGVTQPPLGSGIERCQIVQEGYGDPVIGPDGSIYTWKRTPDNYKILKWTWNSGQ